MTTLNDIQALGAWQMIYKLAAEKVKTGDPDSLRGKCDEALREQYETMGVDRYRIAINGVEIGTLSAVLTKPSTETIVYVNDPEALVHDDPADILEYIRANAQAYADWRAAQGETDIPGCEVVVHETPGGVWKNSTLRGCDPKHLGTVMGELPDVIAGLLGGGDESQS